MTRHFSIANTDDLLERIVERLPRGGSPDGRWPDSHGDYWSLCPFHADTTWGSFHVGPKGYKCFSCGAKGGLGDLGERLGVIERARVQCDSRGYTPPPPPTSEGFSLGAYAEAKRLPVELLERWGLSTVSYRGSPAVRIPYRSPDGLTVAVRFRVKLHKPENMYWRKGDAGKIVPYGLWRLREWDGEEALTLVEGESDCHTLWLHGIPALGVPGANMWQGEWAEYCLPFDKVYVWQEPDEAGARMVADIGKSLPGVRIMRSPEGTKDPSAVYLQNQDLLALLSTLRMAARSWVELQAEAEAGAARDARAEAGELPEEADILAAFWQSAEGCGLVGEEKVAKLLYLALTSRLLGRPVNVALKGPSAGGKSYVLQTVLDHFPTDAYLDFSSMSEHALVYDDRPIAHRHIVLYEATGMGSSDLQTYLLRSLLSEGRVKYTTVEKGPDGLRPVNIERKGPTGLLCTTTAASLHAENETRLLSLTIRDDAAQTQAVFQALADQANGHHGGRPDLNPWKALQTWLALGGERRVTIPFAAELAARVAPVAVRLRRDFGAVLSLTAAHALLHQAKRERDEKGRVIATTADYGAVYGLVLEAVSEGVQATVSLRIRETVEAVRSMSMDGKGVTISRVARVLHIDRSSASRRVAVATDNGWVLNQEDNERRPACLVVGEPMPAERPIFPEPEGLGGGGGSIPPLACVHACTPTETVGGEGDITPSGTYARLHALEPEAEMEEWLA